MTDLDGFHRELIADIRNEADAAGIFTVEAFFEKMAEVLSETGELETADRCFFEARAGRVNMRVDGYGGDPRDSDGVLSLIICDFEMSEEPQVLQGERLKSLFKRLIEFVQHSRKRSFRESLEETSAGFGLADLVATTWKRIIKIKLILLTNRTNRSRVDAVPAGMIDEIPVTYNIWDLPRIHRYVTSGRVRDDLIVDFTAEFGGSVPVLKASFDSTRLESYVAVIPGTQLAEIYDKWGMRLLEANVRCFLQARTKVNRGIRDTIKDKPEMFFSYNNGITATAEEVVVIDSPRGPRMDSARNLQIVNGGQTTATVHAALKLAPEQLKDVFVQMKLSIVPAEESEDIVPKISEFANSQNRINAADFFSNHPFHVRMEEFSRRMLASAPDGGSRETKWFYERARGQYADERGKRTQAARKKFDLEFPRAQYFTKTDLAKFECSYRGEPHIVSRGAQKNFAEFAKAIGEEWSKSKTGFDETWYRRLIAKAIMFRTLEKIVPKQEWYLGGYRANIVTYAIAKVVRDVQQMGSLIDLDAVWKAQVLPEPLEAALVVAASKANAVITNPDEGIRNMSEWAKKQVCWARLRSSKFEYGSGFEKVLVDPEEAEREVRSARKNETMASGIGMQTAVLEAGAKFWADLRRWGLEQNLLGPKADGILATCAAIPYKLPSEKQCIVAIQELERLKEKGYTGTATAD